MEWRMDEPKPIKEQLRDAVLELKRQFASGGRERILMSQIDRVPCPICGGPREILMETNHAQHIYCAECDRETMRTHELVTAETRMKEEYGR
jgi:LSD1 subclass zinc finger protein